MGCVLSVCVCVAWVGSPRLDRWGWIVRTQVNSFGGSSNGLSSGSLNSVTFGGSSNGLSSGSLIARFFDWP